MPRYFPLGQTTNIAPLIPGGRDSLMAVIDLNIGAARLVEAYPDVNTRPSNIQNAIQELSNLSTTYADSMTNANLKTHAQNTINTLADPGDGYKAILGLRSFNMMIIAMLSGFAGLTMGWIICCYLRRYKK